MDDENLSERLKELKAVAIRDGFSTARGLLYEAVTIAEQLATRVGELAKDSIYWQGRWEFLLRLSDQDETAVERAEAAEARVKELEKEVQEWHDLPTYAMGHKDGSASMQREVEQLRAHILDIDAHATPYGDLPDEPGWVGTYLVTAGALHRALGKIGHSSPSCDAEARCERMREAGERYIAAETALLTNKPNHKEWTEAKAAFRAVLDTDTTAGEQGPPHIKRTSNAPVNIDNTTGGAKTQQATNDLGEGKD